MVLWPWDVCHAVDTIGGPCRYEQEVRESIQIGDGLAGPGLFPRQRYYPALCPSTDYARVVEGRGLPASSWQDEGVETAQIRFEKIDIPFEPLHVGFIEKSAGQARRSAWHRAQLGTQEKEIRLNLQQHGVEGRSGIVR